MSNVTNNSNTQVMLLIIETYVTNFNNNSNIHDQY